MIRSAAIILALLWLAPALGAAPLSVDRAALLEAICQHETRGEPEPHAAIGDGGEAIGRCQVQIGTVAWLLGWDKPFEREILRAALPDPEINLEAAGMVLDHCLARTNTIARAVYCYNAGSNAPWNGPTEYTKAVLLAYAEARRTAQWRGQ